MNSRSASREIVVLALPQLPKEESKLEKFDFDQMLLALSRSLSDYAKKNLNSVIADLIRMEKFLMTSEIEHPDNEEHTSQIKPVLIPDTGVLKKQIDLIKLSATELWNSLELPELITHTKQDGSIEYAKWLFSSFVKNKVTIDNIIEEAAQKRKSDKKWKLNRMVRLDRDILRIATTELIYSPETPIEVICDESVKIADKYGGDESKKFVNGVLRDIVELTRQKVS